MVLKVVGKGDLSLLSNFQKNDFENYELYLSIYDEKIISDQLRILPRTVKISSIHTPSMVDVGGRRHPFDIAAVGNIGAASLSSLKKTVELAKRLGASVVVIHGASYNAFNDSKEESFERLAQRVLPLYDYDVKLCFENDVRWHNLYYHRRSLLASTEDFLKLDKFLGYKMKITADFEHLNLTFHFQEFVNHLGGEEAFMKRFSLIDQRPFEQAIQRFIKDNYQELQHKFKGHLFTFFETFREKIEHIHINGSDCCNLSFNPHTTLPLIGEHLPLGFKDDTVEDRLDYDFIAKMLHSLPPQKEINIVLEVWRTNPAEFLSASLDSKAFLQKKLNQTKI